MAYGIIVPLANSLSHDIYNEDDGPNLPLTFSGDVIARGGGCGIEHRPGGTIDNCLFVNDGQHGISYFSGGNSASHTNNVATATADILPLPAGQTYGAIEQMQAASGTVRGNLHLAFPAAGGSFSLAPIRNTAVGYATPTAVTFSGNQSYNVGGDGFYASSTRGSVTVSGNWFTGVSRKAVNVPSLAGMAFTANHYSAVPGSPFAASPFWVANGPLAWPAWAKASGESGDLTLAAWPPPVRTLETCAASLGLPATGQALFAALRQQQLGNWDDRLTAAAINDYLRGGFGMGAAVPAVQSAPAKLAGTPIGTAGSYQDAGNTLANALDGRLDTFFDGPAADGCWVGLDLGQPRTVTSVSFAPRAGLPLYQQRMVGGQFQASNAADFSTGVVAFYTVAAPPKPGALTTVAVTVPATYRYVRYLSPPGGQCNVAEVAFWGR